VILIAGQEVAPGRTHQNQTVLVSETTLASAFPDGDTKIISRTTTQPVRSIKGQRPRTATNISQNTACTKPCEVGVVGAG
jgi:hypothetical protein